jgi:hypothetical protein
MVVPSTPRAMLVREDSRRSETSSSFDEGDGASALELRVQRLRRSLESARIPVHVAICDSTRQTVLTVMGCCRVASPYVPETCASADEKVLELVRDLVAEVT